MKRGLLALATALICACGDDGRIGLDPDSSTGCEGSETRCGAACVDVTTDRNHCGGCGMACAAGDVCTLGVCEACSDDLVECAGVCRDLQTDSEHCGACGVVCAAGSACVAGTCETPCEPAQTRCDGVCTDLATDADNCGACGNDCEADESCVLGVCEAGCAPAETECGGACVDLQTSAMHCGACDDPCDDGDTCTGGECIPPTPVAEDCSSIVVLTNGANVVDWEAERADYIEGTPSCGSEPATGPDLVFRYTADEDGPIVFTLDKPAGDSHYLVLSEAVCGTVEEDTCGTDPAGTSVEVDAVMTAGRSIFLYVRGATALPDPLTITVSRGELPCTPGEDGLLSGDTTVVSATGLPTVPRYVAVDDDPDGFVYVGGTSQLYRIPKTGGAFEDVALAAGLTTDELGYDMIVDGDDIYTVDTENAVYRISR
ncbi:MAG: MXAN_6577-like cysteine-rich protein, partial [Myxococcota bacterium]